jgi:hypothetical protein
MLNSSKERFKGGDDSAFDGLHNALQNGVHSERLKLVRRGLLESYKKGSVSFHFHFQESFGRERKFGIVEGNTNAAKYCAVAQFLIPQKHTHGVGVTNPVDKCVMRNGSGQIDGLVLISVVQPCEGYQRLITIPSVVRLQTLNECLNLCGRAVKFPSLNLFSKQFCGFSNDEHIGCAGSAAVDQYELPKELVKGRADVKQKVTDYNAEAIGRLGETNALDTAIKFFVYLRNDLALSVCHTTQDRECSFKMFVCPVDFEANTLKSNS